jgi:UDP-glucose 4-epimerase
LPLPITNLTGRRSLLGIDNLTSAILFALNTPATINETYLLADPQPMTIGEMLKIMRLKGSRFSLNLYVPRPVIRMLLRAVGRGELWSSFMEDLVIDTSKFESLGWRPAKTTSEGLAELMGLQ